MLTRHVLTGASLGAGDTIAAVAVQDLEDGVTRWLRGRYFLDATELGDLIAASGAESVTGAESQAETGEPSAPADRESNERAGVFGVLRVRSSGGGGSHDRASGALRLLARLRAGADAVVDRTSAVMDGAASADDGADHLRVRAERRVREGIRGAVELPAHSRSHAAHAWRRRDSDLCVVNWVMLDHTGGDLVTASAAERRAREDDAREQTMSVVHWLQTEAPRADGGAGWPGLRLRGDVTGTDDGLAKSAYIRESRRLRALTRIVEPHVSATLRAETHPGDMLGERYADSVGIGYYRIDLHPSVHGDNYIDVAEFLNSIVASAKPSTSMSTTASLPVAKSSSLRTSLALP